AYLGRLSEVAPRCDGSAAGLRRACDDGDPGLLWADLDPVHEVRLAPALHLSAERAGLHRPADCRLLPARCPLPPSQWQGIAGSAVDWFCARLRAAGARAGQGAPDERIHALLVREHKLPALCRPSLRTMQSHSHRGQYHDTPANSRARRGSHDADCRTLGCCPGCAERAEPRDRIVYPVDRDNWRALDCVQMIWKGAYDCRAGSGERAALSWELFH